MNFYLKKKFRLHKKIIDLPEILICSSFFDQRGSFTSLGKIIHKHFNTNPAQVNLSITKKLGTVRGLHLQKNSEQKIIKCIKGKIFDVVVDCRAHSPYFGKYFQFELDSINDNYLHIPSGFAHGFQSLLDDTMLLYIHSAEYLSHEQIGINPKDEYLDIHWPCEISEISEKDRNLPNFKNLNLTFK